MFLTQPIGITTPELAIKQPPVIRATPESPVQVIGALKFLLGGTSKIAYISLTIVLARPASISNSTAESPELIGKIYLEFGLVFVEILPVLYYISILVINI